MTQPPPSERGLNLGGGEPAVALAPLNDRQRRLANLIANAPLMAWVEIEKRFISGGERPALEAYGLAHIGNTEVALSKSEGQLVLSLNIGDDDLAHFKETCNRASLSETFRDDLRRGISGSNSLQIEARLVGSNLILEAISYVRHIGEVTDISPQVAAVLLDLLEPRGIGPDLEIEAPPSGEPTAVGVEPDDLVLIRAREIAELVELIEENPHGAWKKIEERFVSDGERPALDRHGLAYIGSTEVIVHEDGDQDRHRLKLSLRIDGNNSALFMETCGSDELDETFTRDLNNGIDGDNTLIINADFSGPRAELTAIILERGVREPTSSKSVSPEVFAALMMRLEKSQRDERSQASPAGGEAAPLTVEQIPTSPRETFAEIGRRIALKGSVGPVNIGRTPATVDIGDDNLKLSFEVDYPNLLKFRETCNSVVLSKAFKDALVLGIRNGKYVLEIEALAGDDSMIQIKALSRDNGGLRRQQGGIQTISREVFAELVGMLNLFDKSSTARPRHAEDRYPHEVVISLRDTDKRGQGHKRKKR